MRTRSYITTFSNTPEGVNKYKTWLKDFRKVVKGGRITKHFRGTSLPSAQTGTRFDVYVHRRIDYTTGTISLPMLGYHSLV